MMRFVWVILGVVFAPLLASGQPNAGLRLNLGLAPGDASPSLGPLGVAWVWQGNHRLRHNVELSDLRWQTQEIGISHLATGGYVAEADLTQGAAAIRYQVDRLFRPADKRLRPYLGMSLQTSGQLALEQPQRPDRFGSERLALSLRWALVPGLQWQPASRAGRLSLHLEASLALGWAAWSLWRVNDPSVPLQRQRIDALSWMALPRQASVIRLGLGYLLSCRPS